MNKKLQEFVNGENTVEIRSKSEFQDFVNLLKRDGVINSVFLHYNDFDYDYWKEIVCASSHGTYDMVFEHDPAYKGVALYTDRRDSMDWYGRTPYTVPELEGQDINMSKYYAVKVGRKEGIFTSWDECRSYVDGYSGAVFKSFTSKSEAQEYMNAPLTENQLAHVSKESPKKPVHVYKDGEKQTGMSLTLNREVEIYDTWPVAYVDGSFNARTGVYGYGGFLLHRDKDGNIQKEVLQGHNNKPEMAAMRNVAGEILGCEATVKKAIALGLKCVIIYYDYAGIELWATGKWKRNKKETKDYYEFMRNAKALTHIVFCKVKGHSGDWGNEEADRLAKQSVGIK